jgi:hypothetical protein
LNRSVVLFSQSASSGLSPVGFQSVSLPPPPNVTDSACLAAKIEQTFHSGSAVYPVERTLLTTGMLEACLHSRHKLNQRLETPQLAVSYQPPAESQYARS